MGRGNRAIRFTIAVGVCLLVAAEGGCHCLPLRHGLAHRHVDGGAPGGCALLPGGPAKAGAGYYCYPRFFPVPSRPVFSPPTGESFVSDSFDSLPPGNPPLPVVPGPPVTEVPDASSWIFPRKQVEGPVLAQKNATKATTPSGLRMTTGTEPVRR